MNKLFKSIVAASVGVAMAIGVGAGLGREASAVQAEESVAYTLTPASGSNNTYAGNCDITVNGITWNLTGNSQQLPWRIGGGKNTGLSEVDRNLYSKTAIISDVTKIEITHGTANGITVNSWTLVVSKNADFSSPVSTLTPTFAASTATTINRPDGSDWSNCYFKFTYNVSVSGTSNKYLEFSEAKFYTEAQVQGSVSIELDKETMNLDLYNATTGTLKAIVSVTGSATNGLSALSDDESVVTISTDAPVSGTAFNVVAHKTGTAHIIVSSNWDDNVSKTCTVTVSDSTPEGFESKQFTQCTQVSDLEVGFSYLITSDPSANVKTMSIFPSTNNRPAVDATVSNGKINSSANMLTVTLEQSGNFWKIKTENNDGGNNYFTQGNQTGNNYLKLSDTGDNWSITFDSGSAVITSQLQSSRNILRYNSTNNIFSCYSSGQQSIYLWKEYSTKTLDGLSLDVAVPTKKDYVSGEHFDPDGLEVYAIWDGVKDTEHNLANSLVWEPDPLTSNTTSVTGTFRTKTVTVEGITVTVGPGSLERPYTVAEAKAAMDSGTGIQNVYIEGIVTQVDYYSESNHYITYWISDDGSVNEFEIFHGKGIGGADFASKDDIVVGATVVVCGNIALYNSTYELEADNQLVSQTLPTYGVDHYLSNATRIATIRGEENESVVDEGSVATTIDQLVSANGWTISVSGSEVCYDTLQLNDNISVSTTGDATCGSIWGTSPNLDWRLYHNKGGNAIVTAKNGYELVSVKFTFALAKNGVFKYLENEISSGQLINLSGTSAEFVVDSTTESKGQVKISAIEVSYKKATFQSIKSLDLRFGAKIPMQDWEAIVNNPNWEIEDYGVMMFLANSKDDALKVKDKYNDQLDFNEQEHVAVGHKGSGATPDQDGNGNYNFTVKVNVPNDSWYNKYFYAAPFIKVNGQVYFLLEADICESVRTIVLAGHNNGTNFSKAAMDFLAGEQ